MRWSINFSSRSVLSSRFSARSRESDRRFSWIFLRVSRNSWLASRSWARTRILTRSLTSCAFFTCTQFGVQEAVSNRCLLARFDNSIQLSHFVISIETFFLTRGGGEGRLIELIYEYESDTVLSLFFRKGLSLYFFFFFFHSQDWRILRPHYSDLTNANNKVAHVCCVVTRH